MFGLSRQEKRAASPEPDPITLEHFPMKRAMWLNKKIYDSASLSRMLKAGRSTVPHSRRRLTPDEIDTIMHSAGRRPKNRYLYASYELPSTLGYHDYQSRTRATKNRYRPS